MGRKETAALDKFIAESHGRLKMYKIENTIASAMPDLVGENRKGSAFWIEGKHIDDWPRRPTTCPLKGAFERGQESWARSWESWNGISLVLLRVGMGRGGCYYLLRIDSEGLEVKTKESLLTNSCVAAGLENIIEYLENI